MESGLSALGIDWRLLIGQAVNFFIVLFILKKFLYQPVIKRLDERRNQIEESIKKAEHVFKEEQKLESKKQKVLAEARKSAEKIIQDTKKSAIKEKSVLLAETHAQQEEFLLKAQRQINREKEKVVQDAKTEIVKIILSLTQKLLKRERTSADEKKYVEELIKKA